MLSLFVGVLLKTFLSCWSSAMLKKVLVAMRLNYSANMDVLRRLRKRFDDLCSLCLGQINVTQSLELGIVL
jgi:hypothetical protein